MRQPKVFVLFVYVALGQAKASFNGATSGLANTESRQLEVNLNAWQPLASHNNWLILQATAATAVQQRPQQQPQRQQQQQGGRLPVNYYAYNHRYQPAEVSEANDAARGNYKQVRSNLNGNPSYAWALSPDLRQLPNAQTEPEVRKRLEPEVLEANNREAYATAADEAIGVLAKPTATAERINNYLETVGEAVLRVRRFCDTVREIISETDEADEREQREQSEQTTTDAATNKLPDGGVTSAAGVKAAGVAGPAGAAGVARAGTATSKEVQGRASNLAVSFQGRKLKKLKKKIQKLFFPLLIAYKLKFLTLIPVLIGGLTLLVGTTGLAGFFFALFTAVMSLKSGTGHASKAIVLKKM